MDRISIPSSYTCIICSSWFTSKKRPASGMMGVPIGPAGNVGMGCQAVALGEGEGEGWRMGVAEGEATGVAVLAVVAVGEPMSVATRVGDSRDAPSKDV
jgi:hypothetical protein